MLEKFLTDEGNGRMGEVWIDLTTITRVYPGQYGRPGRLYLDGGKWVEVYCTPEILVPRINAAKAAQYRQPEAWPAPEP